MNRLRWEPWLPVLVTLLGLALWEWKTRSGDLSALYFPAPSEIAKSFVRLLYDGDLAVNLGATLKRVFLGFLLGASPGLLIGVMMGRSSRIRSIADPFVAALHPIPKIAILPLFMIIFGIGETSKVMVIAVAVFFPLVINAAAGVREIHPVHFEVARNFGAGPVRVFTSVMLPGALPLILAGVRLGLNIALLVTIAIELLAVQTGLGKMMWFAWQTMRTEELYVSLFVTAAVGIGLNVCLEGLRRYLVPWQESE
ncbi:MAG TPA: ABC transporter permease [Gammaproteobacteria bacterium]|nr:ABC transporter permease [Gammaproteobacteria bacterium]